MKAKNKGGQQGAKSPYAKYHKKPHRYSPAYYAWKSKITGKREDKGDE